MTTDADVEPAYCATLRRRLIIALGASAVALPFAAFSQQSGKFARIGFLGFNTAAETESRVQAFRAGLRALGYIEGKNIVIEFRWAAGDHTRLPELAAELVRLKVDVVVTHGTPGIKAAQRATATIPIVMATVGNVVAQGIAGSLARQDRNITGSTILGEEISIKRIELLKEVLPSMSRVAFLSNQNNPEDPSRYDSTRIAAEALKVETQYFHAAGPEAFESVFAEMASKRVDAVVIPNDAIYIANAGAIGALVSQRRIPSIGFAEIAEAGGMMAYGPSITEMFRRAAYFVDRILKGARAGDLPIEQPTKFELVINMKAAGALGIRIPQSILVRADRVIK